MLTKPPTLAPRYNIAPSQLLAVIAPKPDRKKRGLALLKWGLVPEWYPDGKPGPINARAETVASKPTFADSFRERRGLIPSTGFYEWAKHGGKKMPQFIRSKAGGVLAFAGLWSFWRAEEGSKPLLTCCIITTKANELVSQFHDRMPAIIQPKDYVQWLDPQTPAKELWVRRSRCLSGGHTSSVIPLKPGVPHSRLVAVEPHSFVRLSER
jgi:putative SOS response-associated peptidase YedK